VIALSFIDIINVDMTTTKALSFKFVSGLLIGFFTAFLTLTIINLVLNFLNLKYKRIDVFIPSLFNSLFLAVLFVIESLISPIKNMNIILGNAIVGVITTPLALYIILKFYNNQKNKLEVIKEKRVVIKSISEGNTALFAGIYELIALPTMAVLISKGLNFTITGLIAGLTSIIAIIIYNKLPEKRKIKIVF